MMSNLTPQHPAKRYQTRPRGTHPNITDPAPAANSPAAKAAARVAKSHEPIPTTMPLDLMFIFHLPNHDDDDDEDVDMDKARKLHFNGPIFINLVHPNFEQIGKYVEQQFGEYQKKLLYREGECQGKDMYFLWPGGRKTQLAAGPLWAEACDRFAGLMDEREAVNVRLVVDCCFA